MSIKKRLHSIQFAVQGIKDLLKTQPNARFHLLACIGVTAAGFYVQISNMEWVAIILCMAFVVSLEAINTALEYLTDLVSPAYHPLAGKVKDAAAAAVLIAAIGAAVVGIIVFAPKLF